MATKRTGLGKGFAALMPETFDARLLLDASETIHILPLERVVPNPTQPRQDFDEGLLQQLADSIAQHGVLQPIVVTPTEKKDVYRIVAGERRYRASLLAKRKTIPALIRTLEELTELEIALVENVQRVDLAPLEQARSIERLHQQFNLTYDAIAKRLGKAASTINNTVRLLQLPGDALQALGNGLISEGHARAILSLKDFPDAQAQLLDAIVQQAWSVRRAERFVSAIKEGSKERAARTRSEDETPETKQLSKQIGAQIRIKRTAKGGRLEISFQDDAQLKGLFEYLKRRSL